MTLGTRMGTSDIIPHKVTPDPDPKLVSSDGLIRETGHLRDLMETKIDNLATLVNEKFVRVQTQFEERDERTKEAAKSASTAVDFALAAAKEAVEKSAAAVEKRLDGLLAAAAAADTARAEQIRQVEKRVDRGEGAEGGLRQAWMVGIGVVMALIGIASLVISATI